MKALIGIVLLVGVILPVFLVTRAMIDKSLALPTARQMHLLKTVGMVRIGAVLASIAIVFLV